MDYADVYLDMISAYQLELGDAFPSADPRSVLLVLRECNRPEPTSQKQIEEATGIPQPNIAKLIAKMTERGWLDVSKRDPKTNVKSVSISHEGFLVLGRFNVACRVAAKSISKTKGIKKQEQTSQSKAVDPTHLESTSNVEADQGLDGLPF